MPLFATAEEIALAAELAALDRAEDAASAARWDGVDDSGWDQALIELTSADVPTGPGEDALAEAAAARGADLGSWTDDDLVESFVGPPDPADLMLLASIDPQQLSEDIVRVHYLQALDRVAGYIAAKRARAVVALAGERSSEAYLPEVHLEHEIAVARRTSRYAAGKLIETARALATTFPGFAAALLAGEISEAHCSVLVERTRVVADPGVLAGIERRVLPKAKRLTPGELGGEVAKAIALLDRDAASRVRRARATRRVWSRQLPDGMGFVGMTHDWSTIHAMVQAITADGRALQLARRTATAAADRRPPTEPPLTGLPLTVSPQSTGRSVPRTRPRMRRTRLRMRVVRTRSPPGSSARPRATDPSAGTGSRSRWPWRSSSTWTPCAGRPTGSRCWTGSRCPRRSPGRSPGSRGRGGGW